MVIARTVWLAMEDDVAKSFWRSPERIASLLLSMEIRIPLLRTAKLLNKKYNG